ncbi:MTM1 [[Candida] subhashii]|uniref:MTM1 n=1 Tax=[Candida] subhashii TaxID=561895 RepID=A0A8J5QH30_9ASCO|nr:MTM1 [[Candida] subhashii]KAG7661087.1 MTM1 [[Candida] subhashii]
MSLSSEIAGAIEEDDLKFGKQLKKKMKTSDDISITQRMISACSGSLLTSVVVTPFDVIRIRIQQQEILPKESCCQTHFPESFPQVRNTLVKNMATSATTSAAAAATQASATTGSVSPELFWIHNKYCGSGNCTRITNTFQGFATVTKHEGIATLWRGLSLTLLMAIPSNIIYFTGYEYIRDHSPISQHPLNPLLCGSLARIMSASFVAPAELIKTRLQSIPSDSKKSSAILSNLLKDSFSLVKQNGIGTLFKGLQITLWRDVPFSGIYWSSYELCKDRIARGLKTDFNTSNNSNDWKVFATSFLSGSISGTVAAFFTNPFDVGKTRLQITFEESGARGKRENMFKFLLGIYRKEGIGALYTGFVPRVMKIAPACAIMISSYEVGKKFFKNSNN